jgi:prepilin-type N-terminal cleavage/methylation domain-containing protein
MRARGFSLIELMISMAVLLTISAAVFQVVNLATQRSTTEQAKVDMFQEAREFMDQMSRDLRQAGYPNPRNVTPTLLTASPEANDLRAAAGLVKVENGELWFEGDMDGTGTVSVVRYHLDTSTTNNCPCLKRSQVNKVTGDPLSGQSPEQYQVEVQGVQNTNIFTARSDGTNVTLPVTFATSGGVTIATVDTVQAVLTLRSPVVDPQTRQRPVTTLVSTVKLNNCSQAATGTAMSCQ